MYEKDPKGSIHNERRNAKRSKTTLRRTELYEMLKRTTKPLRRTILIEEDLAKSSKKQHSENTGKWHLRKAGGSSYCESLWTPPLEGTSPEKQ